MNALLHHVQGSERRRRRVAARHRPPAGQGHVRRDGRRQERQGPRGAGAAVRGARGREGIRRARLGRRAGGPADRPADRTRSEQPAEDVVARPPRAIGGDAHHEGASPPRRHAVPRRHPTGRTHQIRVHLSAIGHAIVGDATYGGARARVAADLRPVLSLDRPFLHATARVQAPIDGRPMQWEAPLAPDLQHVLDELEALQRDVPMRASAGLHGSCVGPSAEPREQLLRSERRHRLNGRRAARRG